MVFNQITLSFCQVLCGCATANKTDAEHPLYLIQFSLHTICTHLNEVFNVIFVWEYSRVQLKSCGYRRFTTSILADAQIKMRKLNALIVSSKEAKMPSWQERERAERVERQEFSHFVRASDTNKRFALNHTFMSCDIHRLGLILW